MVEKPCLIDEYSSNAGQMLHHSLAWDIMSTRPKIRSSLQLASLLASKSAPTLVLDSTSVTIHIMDFPQTSDPDQAVSAYSLSSRLMRFIWLSKGWPCSFWDACIFSVWLGSSLNLCCSWPLSSRMLSTYACLWWRCVENTCITWFKMSIGIIGTGV